MPLPSKVIPVDCSIPTTSAAARPLHKRSPEATLPETTLPHPVSIRECSFRTAWVTRPEHPKGAKAKSSRPERPKAGLKGHQQEVGLQRSIEKSNLSHQVWSHKVSTFREKKEKWHKMAIFSIFWNLTIWSSHCFRTRCWWRLFAKSSRSVGFEPTPAERNWFLVSRLNHSATTAPHVKCLLASVGARGQEPA